MILRHVGDPVIARAFAEVPRERFLLHPAPLWQVYSDEVVVTYRKMGVISTSSQPTLMAQYMLWACLAEDSRVLEIGSGTGYNAAVMSRVCRRGYVVGVEYNGDMVEFARSVVRDLGYDNVEYFEGDGFYGYSQKAPYTAIIATVAVTEIPIYWFEQLKDGGRIVAPINLKTIYSDPTVVLEKRGKNLVGRFVTDTRFIPARGAFEERYARRYERLKEMLDLEETGVLKLKIPKTVLEFASQKLWVDSAVYFVGNEGYAKLEGFNWRVFGDVEKELKSYESDWLDHGDGDLFETVFRLMPFEGSMVGSFD